LIKRSGFYVAVFSFALLVLSLSGCGPTYPKDRVPEAIRDLCKTEYGVEVEVKVIGRTIGIYVPVPELVDANLAFTKPALEKIDDVVMSASRVALSTDGDFNFFVVIAKDPDMPGMELVLTRCVEDVKRAMVMDISRGEYLERMVTEFNFIPQSSDTGDPGGEFILKDIDRDEFLARQAEQRLRRESQR